MSVPRVGDWMQTYTGKQFYPLDPYSEDVDPLDIAHALSLLCRYNGHCHHFYSVAEHCVLMSQSVPPEYALWALLHDATEAYVGDMIRPLKKHMPRYQDVENRVMFAIIERFNLPREAVLSSKMPPVVKEADNRILLTERMALMPNYGHVWSIDGLYPLNVTICGWSPEHAEKEYLNRLIELGVSI